MKLFFPNFSTFLFFFFIKRYRSNFEENSWIKVKDIVQLPCKLVNGSVAIKRNKCFLSLCSEFILN